jgi:trimeric autotransporter adhesin
MASTINASNSGSGGLISTGDASGVLQLQTASTAALTIDASQNVGIGTTSPTNRLSIVTASGSDGIVSVKSPTTETAGVLIDGGSTSNKGALLTLAKDATTKWRIGLDSAIGGGTNNNLNILGSSTDALLFGTNATERMRINSSGNVGIGTSSPDAQLHVVGQIRSSGSIAQAIYVYGAASVAPYITINQFGVRAWDIGAGTYSSGTFSIQSGGANGVYLGGTATSWASASDERLKDIIEPIDNALTKVNGLRSVIGKYKTDEEGVRRSFLIAQDIQTQFPEALESSDPDKLGVQYTDVIPLLVASIKELKAINDTQAELISGQAATINALVTRIEALENK